MDLDVKFSGFDDVFKKLEQLPRRVESNVVRRAVRAGGAILVKEARSLVPVDSGTLKKSIGQKPQRARKSHFFIQVGARAGKKQKNDAWYAHLIEFGTKYQPARPFLRPAFDKKEKEIVKKIGEKLNEGIHREAKR